MTKPIGPWQGNALMQSRAAMDAVRYEEDEQIHRLLTDLRKEAAEEAKTDEGHVFRHKYIGRDLSHWEVYLEAMDAAMLLVNSRMDTLYERNR